MCIRDSFYSAFMVADKGTIDTLSDSEGAEPVRWISEDGMAFTMETGDRTERGTVITLHISEEESEFLEEYRLREVLHRYCGFMATPVYFDMVNAEEPAEEKAADSENSEGDESPKTDEAPKGPELINSCLLYTARCV